MSWRRQMTAKIKTSANVNCNDVALRYQRRRSRERSWKTLRGLTDGRKKRWTTFGSSTLSKSWLSAIQCSRGAPAWRRRLPSPPQLPAALTGRMATFRGRSVKHEPAFFSSIRGLPATSRAFPPSPRLGELQLYDFDFGVSLMCSIRKPESDCVNLRVPGGISTLRF